MYLKVPKSHCELQAALATLPGTCLISRMHRRYPSCDRDLQFSEAAEIKYRSVKGHISPSQGLSSKYFVQFARRIVPFNANQINTVTFGNFSFLLRSSTCQMKVINHLSEYVYLKLVVLFAKMHWPGNNDNDQPLTPLYYQDHILHCFFFRILDTIYSTCKRGSTRLEDVCTTERMAIIGIVFFYNSLVTSDFTVFYPSKG